MTVFNQSPYLAVKRFLEAFLCAFLLFIVISAAFYGNVLLVCRGEILTGLLFACGAGVLFSAFLFFPGGKTALIVNGESLGVKKGGCSQSTVFYERDDLIRASRKTTPLTRLLGTSKVELTFYDNRFVLYLKNKDLPYLDFFFAQPISEAVQRPKKDTPDDAFCVHPHYGNALSAGACTALVLTMLVVAILPVIAGVLHKNGILLPSFLPNNTFLIRIFVIFVIAIAVAIAVGGAVALGTLLYLVSANANYRLSATGNSLREDKGVLTTRTNLVSKRNLRLVSESAPALSILGKNKTVTLFFGEGKRRFSLTFGGQAVTESERAELFELIPEFTHAACEKQPIKRFAPKLCLAAIAILAPIVLFSFLTSPMVAYLILPAGGIFYARCKNWAFGENEDCITVRSGALTLRYVTARKKDVSAVRLHSAPIARIFGVVNAEICLLSTEMSLSIPSLTKKEGDIMANLIKTVKNI